MKPRKVHPREVQCTVWMGSSFPGTSFIQPGEARPVPGRGFLTH